MAHDWKIPQREYARQEARRGRRHAFETLDPASTALVVVDMVPFFVEASDHCRDAVAPINRLAEGLRGAGGVVAWVLPSSEEPFPDLKVEFFGPDIAQAYAASGGAGPLPGRVSSHLATQAGDVFVEKTAASAFFPGRCDLPEMLRTRGVSTVVIAGTVTNVCCESSARDASTLGFRVIMAADAMSAPTDEMHNATLTTIYRTFGDVRGSDEILGLIEAARDPGRQP
ncbi:isochorismatase family protein [Phenylobacterium sp.]|uniref:isochorismatase family protein n=1 Tax=Phenylobacterium sp. TaxID=1871053 RepID=UPI0035B1BCD7